MISLNIKKIVIAPDSFKESMTAKQAGLAIEQGFKNIFGDALKTEVIPMADGGRYNRGFNRSIRCDNS